MSVFDRLAAHFPPTAVSWRPGPTNSDKTSAMALAYIDARDVMDRLDAVLGPDWQCEYVPMPNGTCCCRIGVLHDGIWRWRSDGALTISDSAKPDAKEMAEKGSYSDAFKRAAVRWGVGRYLYDLKTPWVPIVQKGNSYVITEEGEKKLRDYLTRVGRADFQAPPSSPPPAPKQEPKTGDVLRNAPPPTEGGERKASAAKQEAAPGFDADGKPLPGHNEFGVRLPPTRKQATPPPAEPDPDRFPGDPAPSEHERMKYITKPADDPKLIAERKAAHAKAEAQRKAEESAERRESFNDRWREYWNQIKTAARPLHHIEMDINVTNQTFIACSPAMMPKDREDVASNKKALDDFLKKAKRRAADAAAAGADPETGEIAA